MLALKKIFIYLITDTYDYKKINIKKPLRKLQLTIVNLISH